MNRTNQAAKTQEITAGEFKEIAWKSWFNANPNPTELEIKRTAWKLEKLVRGIKSRRKK